MNAPVPHVSPQSAILPPAEELDRALRHALPAEIVTAALHTVGRDRLAVVSSFGTESAALLKVIADVDPATPVIFLDTGWLFEETLAYRDTLIKSLGLRDVRSIKPSDEALSRDDPERDLWFSNPDACCRIRKVEPLARGADAVRCLDQRAQAISGWASRRDCRSRIADRLIVSQISTELSGTCHISATARNDRANQCSNCWRLMPPLCVPQGVINSRHDHSVQPHIVAHALLNEFSH